MTWNPSLPQTQGLDHGVTPGSGAIGAAADRLGHPPPAPVAVVEFPDYPHQRDIGGRRRKLVAPYRYEWPQDGERYRLTLRMGFEHDGASVPRFVWSLFPPHPLDRAAPGHDAGYGDEVERGDLERLDEHGVWRPIERPPRKWWDVAFRIWLAMTPGKVSRWRRWAAYWGVRSGGAFAWQE